MNPIKKTQIETWGKTKGETQVQALLFDKALIVVLAEYSNYGNVFLIENTIKLSKHIKINIYTIKLKKNNQPLFEPIYSIVPVKLKMLITYIKTDLANSFIQSS